MTVEPDIDQIPATRLIDAINMMTYPEMLDAWMTGSIELTPGSPESNAFNARFQKLRAELPTEEISANSKRTNRPKNKKKAGRNHGKR